MATSPGSHFSDGVTGAQLYVGSQDNAIKVADGSGNLFQAGTQITSTAAELNKLDMLTGEKLIKAVTGTIAYDVASPYTVSLGTAPNGAIVFATIVEIITAFNAGTTNVLEVGTSATANAYVQAADVNETATGTTVVSRSATLSAATEILAKYTQTGTAATAGLARVTVLYLV